MEKTSLSLQVQIHDCKNNQLGQNYTSSKANKCEFLQFFASVVKIVMDLIIAEQRESPEIKCC